MQMTLLEKLTGLTEGRIGHRFLLSGHRRLGEGGMEKREGAACREGFKSRSRKKKFKTG